MLLGGFPWTLLFEILATSGCTRPSSKLALVKVCISLHKRSPGPKADEVRGQVALIW